jgi:cellulose synthase/poly-beta-1,6-N-acetylglucosamine synthase-like glycosyltransferase
MNTTKRSPLGANEKTTRTLEDVIISVKIKLSALWVTLMLLYIYADILGFYTPGVIEKVVSGEIGGIQITEGFLIVMAIWMAIPSLMVFLSLTLKANANRWVNIIVGIVSIVVLVATFFMGEFSARYTVQAIVEGALIVLILWQAWKWPKQERVEITP